MGLGASGREFLARARACRFAGFRIAFAAPPGQVPPVTEIEHSLLEALIELERAAASGRGSQGSPTVKTPILPILERIDRLASELPATAPGDLRHYLQRKSYEKARLFLMDRDGENARGGCGH